MIMSLKQKKTKFKPRIKLNYNRYIKAALLETTEANCLALILFTEAYERFRSGLMTLLSLINLCISVVWFSLIIDLPKVFPKSSLL